MSINASLQKLMILFPMYPWEKKLMILFPMYHWKKKLMILFTCILGKKIMIILRMYESESDSFPYSFEADTLSYTDIYGVAHKWSLKGYFNLVFCNCLLNIPSHNQIVSVCLIGFFLTMEIVFDTLSKLKSMNKKRSDVNVHETATQRLNNESGDGVRCSRGVSRSCSTYDARRVTDVSTHTCRSYPISNRHDIIRSLFSLWKLKSKD